jgi:hypothetical protein
MLSGLVVVSSVMDGIFCNAHQKFTCCAVFLVRDRTSMTESQQRSFICFLSSHTRNAGWEDGWIFAALLASRMDGSVGLLRD